tara:strand:- start:331 stop:717 length:387 start_codon:yes stop_codon:yes gene_type:complete
MGQQKVLSLPLVSTPAVQFLKTGIELVPRHLSCEQHAAEPVVGCNACVFQPFARDPAEHLQNCPFEEASVAHGVPPVRERQARRQWFTGGADPGDLGFTGLIQQAPQNNRHQMNVLMPVHGDQPLVGE